MDPLARLEQRHESRAAALRVQPRRVAQRQWFEHMSVCSRVLVFKLCSCVLVCPCVSFVLLVFLVLLVFFVFLAVCC